jgi:hypothetical protein
MSTHAMTTTAFLLGLPLIQHRSIVTAPLSPRQRWVYACASSSTTTSISTASNDKSIAPRLRVVKVPRVFEHADTAVDTMLRPSPLHREAHHFVDGGLVLAQTVVRQSTLSRPWMLTEASNVSRGIPRPIFARARGAKFSLEKTRASQL